MNILALSRKNSACDFHRVTTPMQFLPKEERDNYVFAWGPETNQVSASKVLSQQDIVFFNRIPNYNWEHLVVAKRKYGFQMVMDIDDYWELYTTHIQYREWEKVKMTERLKNAMIQSDVVITTNERLGREVYKLNSKVIVVPNAFPFGSRQFIPDTSMKMDKISFVYAGGNSHYWDLKTIDPIFTKVRGSKELQEKMQFVLAGYTQTTEGDAWNGIYNIMNTSNVLITRPRKELDSYMSLYDGCHVALAPLQDRKFNTFKSTLKIVEAGCKKMPIICSNIYPYLEDECMDGKGLILCRKTSDWLDAIEFFIKNPDKITEFGETLFGYVLEKYDIAKANEQRLEIFKSLL